MRIISKRTHSYAAKERRPGASYEATKEHAKFLVGQGFAEYAKPAVPVMPIVEGELPKGGYKTREVKAEDKHARAEDVERTKREYKRRDLKAEE